MKILLATILLIWPGEVVAQYEDYTDPHRSLATREQLQSLLHILEQTIASPVYSTRLKEVATNQADAVRLRIEEGDMQVGDRILLTVETSSVQQDTLVVTNERTVEVRSLGTLSLHGVLRSELDDRLSRFVTRFIREPVVRVSTFIRLSVTGSVRRPGFLLVASDRLVADVIMSAGGPTERAKIEDTRVVRDERTLIDADHLISAIVDGRTLDQLGLRDGDQLDVPGPDRARRERSGIERAVRLFSTVLSIPATLFAVTRLF